MERSKKVYSSVDIAKLIFCLCIVCLHAQDYYTFQSDIVWFIRQFVFRTAVPFFFVASGYFLGIKLKKNITIRDNIRYVIKGYCIVECQVKLTHFFIFF